MARKIKLVAQAAVGTDGDDILIGSNREDQPGDVLDGGAGNDYLNPFQGADSLTGGSGSDIFHFDSWAASNVTYGVDTITDFSGTEGDKLSSIKHYNMDGSVRALDWSDVSFSGDTMNVSVVEGDNRWDVSVVVLGEVPTVNDMVF